MRIGLVGCVKSKCDHPAEARDLYTSPLFEGRRHFVERTCDRWFVMSALHGLVEPDQVLEPYDRTLKGASRDERRQWGRSVVDDLKRRIGPLERHTFELHAGGDYLDWGLASALEDAGAQVERPTEGLRLGDQLRFYKDTK